MGQRAAASTRPSRHAPELRPGAVSWPPSYARVRQREGVTRTAGGYHSDPSRRAGKAYAWAEWGWNLCAGGVGEAGPWTVRQLHAAPPVPWTGSWSRLWARLPCSAGGFSEQFLLAYCGLSAIHVHSSGALSAFPLLCSHPHHPALSPLPKVTPPHTHQTGNSASPQLLESPLPLLSISVNLTPFVTADASAHSVLQAHSVCRDFLPL